MADIIKAKPTLYKGIQFKSRLEAKTAYLLDLLNADWEYEPIQENGYTVDFVVHNVIYETPFDPTGDYMGYVEDVFIECKDIMRPERDGLKSDAKKIEEFVTEPKQFRPLIIMNTIQKQFTNNWDDFSLYLNRLSNSPLKGDNPDELSSFSSVYIDGGCRTIAPMITNRGEFILTYDKDDEGTCLPQYIDKKKTLEAYQLATSRQWDDEVERLNDRIRELESKQFKPEKKNEETKSCRMQLLVKPSTKKKLKAIAHQHEMSMNDYVNQLLEVSLNGD